MADERETNSALTKLIVLLSESKNITHIMVKVILFCYQLNLKYFIVACCRI